MCPHGCDRPVERVRDVSDVGLQARDFEGGGVDLVEREAGIEVRQRHDRGPDVRGDQGFCVVDHGRVTVGFDFGFLVLVCAAATATATAGGDSVCAVGEEVVEDL